MLGAGVGSGLGSSVFGAWGAGSRVEGEPPGFSVWGLQPTGCVWGRVQRFVGCGWCRGSRWGMPLPLAACHPCPVRGMGRGVSEPLRQEGGGAVSSVPMCVHACLQRLAFSYTFLAFLLLSPVSLGCVAHTPLAYTCHLICW